MRREVDLIDDARAAPQLNRPADDRNTRAVRPDGTRAPRGGNLRSSSISRMGLSE
jgi:hypothetical protein